MIYLPFFYAFLISVILTLLFIPLTIKFAKKFKLVDDPNLRPHPAHTQQRIVPRAGGLAIFFGILIPILILIPLDKHIIGILFGILILLVIGLLDDALKNFSPLIRLVFQFIAAGIVVISGVGITFITNPLGGIIKLDSIVYPVYIFGPHNIVLLADIFAFLWIVWMMNIVNWSKGVDGQMPGIIFVTALTIAILSYNLFSKGDLNQLSVTTLALITAGTSVGFLFFNWYPAKIFPGFSGSTILGFMIATLSILSGAKLATALMVLLIPAVDFLYTFFRRILSKKSPFLGDQQHLHHLLLKHGWSHKRISLFYIISCAILGLISTTLHSQGKLFVILGIGVVALGTIIWLQYFYQEDQLNS